MSDVNSLVSTSVTLESVHLHQFRNYRQLSLNFQPGFTILSGANAQGKTNLLEAIYLVSTGRLLRGKRDAEAILEGCDSCKVQAEIGSISCTLSVELYQKARKRAFINHSALTRSADLLGRFPITIVSTQDLLLTRGEPADRRLFLDLELSSLYPSYLRHLAVYKRSLEQRNALLKSGDFGPVSDENMEVWEQKLAESGAAIREARFRYVQDLNSEAERFHYLMGQGEKLALHYLAKDGAEHREHLLQRLAELRIDDFRRGTTSVGPHRDDLLIEIEGRDCRLFGSQGQQRTAAISMKLGGFEVAKTKLGVSPVLLLDDVFSDLDAYRRESLSMVALDEAEQTILTCTEAETAGKEILKCAQIFRVEGGAIHPL